MQTSDALKINGKHSPLPTTMKGTARIEVLVATLLYEERRERGLTLEAFGSCIGVDPVTLDEFERAEFKDQDAFEVLNRVAARLGKQAQVTLA